MSGRTGILLGLAICFASLPATARLRVVGTLPDFAAIATEIGGDRVHAESLIRGTQDPHYVDAKPSMILRVNRADLLICIGMGLEDGWLPVLMTQSRNGEIQVGQPGYLDASTVIAPMEVPVNPDRTMGDVHGAGNPHYYTSPREMFQVAEAIYRRLVQLDPEGRRHYETGWKAFEQKYREKMTSWKSRLSSFEGFRVIVYHESWIYMLEWSGLKKVGALEPVPGIPPNPRHVTKVLNKVRELDVGFVIQEIYHPTNLSKIFATKAKARLVILPSMVGAEPAIKTISDKFDRIIKLLTEAG
ncbi:MAG: zinc ABC transporter substrate-binding protein [Deltaproteobacteria bacterium]|nr:zinc ABC transporter substrate-binding protein [Deltaproteobacteria bacterium]